jgi:archaetidylinositol phosphate synthase
MIGLLAACTYALTALYGRAELALTLLLLSGFFDAVDGVVARLRGEASKLGAFIDSVADRASDSLYALGLILLGFNPVLVVAFTSCSLMVSYIRAKFEALVGHSMEGVGFMERAERVIALALLLAVYLVFGASVADTLLAIVVLLTLTTIVERFARGYTVLKRAQEASPTYRF